MSESERSQAGLVGLLRAMEPHSHMYPLTHSLSKHPLSSLSRSAPPCWLLACEGGKDRHGCPIQGDQLLRESDLAPSPLPPASLPGREVLVAQSCPSLSDPMNSCYFRLLCPWDSTGENAGVGSHALLQGIFPTQRSNPGLLDYRGILYRLSHRLSLNPQT